MKVRNSDNKYKNLDDSVLYTIYVARKAIDKTDWKSEDNFGINIGSSRGATSLFEKYHKEFLETGKSSTLSSPTTTLGNISSWIAHDLQSNGTRNISFYYLFNRITFFIERNCMVAIRYVRKIYDWC